MSLSKLVKESFMLPNFHLDNDCRNNIFNSKKWSLTLFEDSGIYSSKYTTQGKEELHSISLCADANLAFLSNKPIKYFWEHLTGPQIGKMQ